METPPSIVHVSLPIDADAADADAGHSHTLYLSHLSHSRVVVLEDFIVIAHEDNRGRLRVFCALKKK